MNIKKTILQFFLIINIDKFLAACSGVRNINLTVQEKIFTLRNTIMHGDISSDSRLSYLHN